MPTTEATTQTLLTVEQRKVLTADLRRLERQLVKTTLERGDTSDLLKQHAVLIAQLGTSTRSRETLKFRAVYKSHVIGGRTQEELLAKLSPVIEAEKKAGKGGSDKVAIYELVSEMDS
jgi:hypothetical protein